MIPTFILFLTSINGSSFAHANPTEFDLYPAPVEAITCKPLDYSSYFQAERGKSNIQRANSNFLKPNFGGKYLLLKNELLMDTLWLIADCKTGKFFHEKTSGKIGFRPDSLLIVIPGDSSKRLSAELQTWSGEEWVKVEESAAAPTPEAKTSGKTTEGSVAVAPPAPKKPGNTQYDLLFDEFKTTESIDTCKKLDFGSYFRAQNGKDNILKLNLDRSHPNFSGKYILIKNQLMFDTLWLIADCTTGKFLPYSLQGNASFKKESSFALLTNSGEFPELMSWTGEAWIKHVNLIQPNHDKVSNSIEGHDAGILFDSLPNPNKIKIIRLNHLICETACKVEIDGKPFTLDESRSKAVIPVIRKWGVPLNSSKTEFKIGSGRCSREKSIPICEIENSSQPN